MKCNVRELAHLCDQPCIVEGRLNYKKITNGGYRNQSVFKERWFRLINNYLFYFKISEMGKFDTKNPAGVFLMENSSIQMEHGQSIPFSFSISFIDEPERRHVFAARSEDNVVLWVMKLRECSYEYLRGRLHALQSKIYSLTGKDPLLLVPRNDGACLWAPSEPFSTTPACSVNTNSFSCHLHTSSAFTLERSKSDVQAHRHFHTELNNAATFYTKTTKQVTESSSQNFGLERSKTSALLESNSSSNSNNIFDNRPKYSRAAPSPPARARQSPAMRRADVAQDVKTFSEKGKYLSASGTGILDDIPVPPRRRLSPKPVNVTNVSIEVTNSSTQQTSRPEDEDLIKF